MISKAEIEKLASLSRVALTPAEKDNFTTQIDAILGYVDQLKKVSVQAVTDTASAQVNVLREDANPHEPGKHTEAILAVAPAKEGQYIKVKKIIG
ncbi:MAG: hypothetical protein RLZZ347_476 [Candidatus Parcubacteria bacterium]|jgi:aspartyl-tRNA(Asn)/glutamyl-tRNA(Gln) amidotransferase subunit C